MRRFYLVYLILQRSTRRLLICLLVLMATYLLLLWIYFRFLNDEIPQFQIEMDKTFDHEFIKKQFSAIETEIFIHNKISGQINETIDKEINFIKKRVSSIETDQFGRCLKRSKVINYTYDWKMKPSACSEAVNVILLIKSSIYRGPLRWTLRRTWAQNISTKGYHIKRIFVIGSAPTGQIITSLNEELSKFDDILQGYFEDVYKAVTKKVYLGMRFVKLYCPLAEMIWITDDDAVILPWNLLSYFSRIGSLNDMEALFAGFTIGRKVLRSNSPQDRWRVSFEEYSCPYYPDYPSGTLYVLSSKTMNLFYLYTRAFDPFFLDDVLFGVIARLNKVKLHQLPVDRFSFSCNGVFSSHLMELPATIDYFACHGADLPAEQLYMWQQYCALPVSNTTSLAEMLNLEYCFGRF